jgi:hypothetical protein
MEHCTLHQVGQMMTGNAQFLAFGIPAITLQVQSSKTTEIPCGHFFCKLGGVSSLCCNCAQTNNIYNHVVC